jgi:c-di-GMP-binding flagellar brake protein YcgR
VNNGLNKDRIDDRFCVRGRMEILHVLHDLIYRREPVSVNFNDGADTLLSTLLEVRSRTLIFELSSDSDANLRVMKSPACSFVARPGGICVQFAGGPIRRISWGGDGAFSVPLPDRLARLQRQESYRIPIPAQNALTVKLFSNDGIYLGEWPLHDLSVGGVGVTVSGPSRVELGRTIARVSLLLPGHGAVDSPVTLRHATDLAIDERDSPYRIGVEFSDLPAEMGAAIQRYIIKLEYARRGLANEDAADDHY